jgi:MoaA/NifB/PqqE/SkfB family radical SAM enzyme
MLRIPEIELAFSNACIAACYICSPTHGGDNFPLMTQKIFDKCVSDLKNIQFDIIQTGGDGDSFLNPIFIDALRTLRREFPRVKIVLYSNFDLLTPERADIIISENLINELYTRIDTLDSGLFKVCTGLDQENVFSNIEYFISKNKKILFQINYSNIKDYFNKCKQVLGTTPFFWKEKLFDAPDDEYTAIMRKFENARFSKIKHSLWAERHNPEVKAEPDLPCGRTYCFDNTCYIWTDGDVGICAYDDGQDTMIVGNVMKESIDEIWTCESRMKMIEKVKNRGIKGYPCVNPKCCLFY